MGFAPFLMVYCPECSVESGTPVALYKSDDNESAECRCCGTAYRDHLMVLSADDLGTIAFRLLSRIAPNRLAEEVALAVDAGLAVRLEKEEQEADDD